MIRLDEVNLIERGRAVLDRVSFEFRPGIWHLSDAVRGDARLLIDLLAGHRAPQAGIVQCRGARSWPLAQATLLGSHLSGLDLIDALASLYALDRRGTMRLFRDLFADPDRLDLRFDRWPPALQRQFGHIAFLAPAFDVYVLDMSPVLPDRDFYARWRLLFRERIVGKTTIIASGDHRAALADFPGERLAVAGGGLCRIEVPSVGRAPAIAAE